MFCLHVYDFSRLKFLLVLLSILFLASCSAEETNNGSSNGSFGPGPEVVNILGLRWTAPSLREDGAGLQLSEIERYRVYYGTTTGDYQNQVDIIGGKTLAQINDLPSGAYYVVVTTVDTDGRESKYSSEIVVNL